MILAVAAVPWQVFAARSVHGVSIGIRDPVVGAMIAEHGGKKRIAQSFAWYQTAKSVAGNAGKALAPALLVASSGNFTLVYLVACALSALPIIVVVVFIKEPPRASRVSVVQMSHSRVQAAKAEKAAAPVSRQTLASFMGLGFLVSATANMLSGLFPLIVTEYAGLSEGVLSMLYIVGTAAAFTGPISAGCRTTSATRSCCRSAARPTSCRRSSTSWRRASSAWPAARRWTTWARPRSSPPGAR